jgi:hypothetical protein
MVHTPASKKVNLYFFWCIRGCRRRWGVYSGSMPYILFRWPETGLVNDNIDLSKMSTLFFRCVRFIFMFVYVSFGVTWLGEFSPVVYLGQFLLSCYLSSAKFIGNFLLMYQLWQKNVLGCTYFGQLFCQTHLVTLVSITFLHQMKGPL